MKRLKTKAAAGLAALLPAPPRLRVDSLAARSVGLRPFALRNSYRTFPMRSVQRRMVMRNPGLMLAPMLNDRRCDGD
jgi:hypothetical protein